MIETMFIGREKEFKQLLTLLDKSSASMGVVKGRRRIGKSRLVEEFGKEASLFFFSFLGYRLIRI